MTRSSTPTCAHLPSPRRSPRIAQIAGTLSPPRAPLLRRSPRLSQVPKTPYKPLFAHSSKPTKYQIIFNDIMRKVLAGRRRPQTGVDIGRQQSGTLFFQEPLGSPTSSKSAMWSFTPRSGVSKIAAKGREIGDIHFSLLPDGEDVTFYVCIPRGHSKRGHWVTVERGFEHPLHPNYLLYQQGRLPPRWVNRQTFSRLIHFHGGNLAMFNA